MVNHEVVAAAYVKIARRLIYQKTQNILVCIFQLDVMYLGLWSTVCLTQGHREVRGAFLER